MKVDDVYVDRDLALLRKHLSFLDHELAKVNTSIKRSADPESDGWCEAGEYFIGHGFVAIQRYLTVTHTTLKIAKSAALAVPPAAMENLTFAAAINAGANYWKHVEGWIEDLNNPKKGDLTKNAQKTIDDLEKITDWADYTCSNLLAYLGDSTELTLSKLLPIIIEWRNNLISQAI
ncbi:hypothetical protein [Acidocella sp.]|nr:hypothetical protein [Acidocella sp.]